MAERRPGAEKTGEAPKPKAEGRHAIKLRPPFDRFPHPYAYALLLDAVDVFGGFLPVAGELIDVLQTMAALFIFENASIALISGPADFVLAGLFDFLPTYTLRIFLAKRGVLN